MKELWKNIRGYDDYYLVSNKGRVKSIKTGKIRKLFDNNQGYMILTLSKNGRKKGFSVHRLVAINFLRKRINRNSVNHKDGNQKNNNIRNLEWVTNSENLKHWNRNNPEKHSSNNRIKYMIENKLKEIRTKKKMTLVQFAKFLGIKSATGEYFSLERGNRTPKVDKAVQIARKLNKKVEQIWLVK